MRKESDIFSILRKRETFFPSCPLRRMRKCVMLNTQYVLKGINGMKPQKAVWLETGHIAAGTGILCALTVVVFVLIGRFDWTVLTGALVGFLTATGNFFFMAWDVQKITHGLDPEEADAMKQAKLKMKLSYNRRLILMGVILVAAIKLLDAHWITCLLPLLFPRMTILAMDVLKKIKAKGSEY